MSLRGWSIVLGLLGAMALIDVASMELHGPEWAQIVGDLAM